MFAKIVTFAILLVFTCQLISGRITIRSKRQIEREFGNESVVITDTGRRDPNRGNNPNRDPETFPYEPIEPIEPSSNDPNTDVMEVDFNDDDGTFTFGGRFPPFPSFPGSRFDFNNAFNNVFRQMTKRFEDMAKRMYENFNNSTAQYPNNYNGTKEEIITINGKQYMKKTHVIKKTEGNSAIFLTSTSYEPVDESANEN